MDIKAPDAHTEINLAGGSKSPPAKDDFRKENHAHLAGTAQCISSVER